jgi:hypothetical protein
MSSGTHNIDAIIDAIPGRKIPMPVVAGGGALALIGMGGFAYGLATGQANWAWGGFLVGLVFVMGLSMGGIIFSVVLTLAKGHWGRPLKRIAESFGFFLPFAYLALLVLLFGGLGLYPWNPDTFIEGGPVSLAVHSEFALPSKEMWLSAPLFIGRQALGTLLLFCLGGVYLYTSIKPDLIRAKVRLGDKAPAWWSRITGTSTDWKGEMAKSEKRLHALAIAIGIIYALVFSLVAFDLLMSLSPWWYANMFGAWFFMSSFWTSMAALGIYTLVAKDWLGLSDLVTKSVTHDLGKLILAWTMFWAYTTFAQILPIWYAQMPEELDYLLVRMYLPQWSWLANTVAVMCFVMPFTVLLSRGIKKMKWPFIAILSVILVGVFLERSLLVYPSVHMGETFPTMTFIICGVLPWLGFMGAFTAVVTVVLSKIPPIPIADPKLEPHPWDVHVHSLDQAHH